MNPELLAYPFLFLTIFFESFVLVTFLSAPAKWARVRRAGTATPSVAIIVPCLNEAQTVAATIRSLLALTYPKKKLEILVVDNASTDKTPQVLQKFSRNPQVKVLYEARRGKHVAVNTGINATSADLVGCLDADSFVEPQSLREIVGCFDNPRVGAATAAMSVHKPKNFLQHMQNAEYIFGILLKHAMSTVRGIHVTPGPFSLYRRDVLIDQGLFRAAYQTEDLEMCLRLQRAGYLIENAPHARVYTKAPATVLTLLRQRTRWTTGFLRNVLFDYRDLVGNPRFGALGLIVLPTQFLAIGSSLVFFGLSMTLLFNRIAHAYALNQGIPLPYALGLQHAPTFDWFYAPTHLYLVLSMISVAGVVLLITLGKRISKTPARLLLGLASYVLLYGLIAPLWLMRATVDVAIGKTRAWR